jgi:hypothetical protein
LPEEAVFDLPEHKGRRYRARAGPCFLAESTAGKQWSRDPSELDLIVNRDDIVKLVLFDTWVRNRDRHHPDPSVRKPNYGNVYFTEVEGGPHAYRLIAMDHTHCFDNVQLHAKLANIDLVKDELIYGLFPAFVRLMSPIIVATACARLKMLVAEEVRAIINEVPKEWNVDLAARDAWHRLVCDRATFVAEDFPDRLVGLSGKASSA